MLTFLSNKKLINFFQKESLKTDLWNLPFIFWGKSSSYFAKKLTPINGGRASTPIAIQLYLTEVCNLNCKMCFLKQIKSNNNFIPIDIAKKVIKELIYIRPRYNMTGGEPFLHPEIKNLITYIKSKGLYLSIITNGTTIENFAETIVRLGVDKLNISIDGTPERHDSVRRVPGTFAKILKGIKAINHEKKKQNKRRPRLTLNSLLNTETDEDFMISFVQENLFEEVNFLHLLSITSEDLKDFCEDWEIKPHYWQGALIKNGIFKIENSLIKKIKEYKNDPNIKIKIRFTPDISEKDLKKYYNKEKDLLCRFEGRCIAPWVAATIKPPGKVEICPDLPVGDLTQKSFLQIWNGEKARYLRRRIFKGNMLPVCSGCCNYYV